MTVVAETVVAENAWFLSPRPSMPKDRRPVSTGAALCGLSVQLQLGLYHLHLGL
jgi:hypothetical protein